MITSPLTPFNDCPGRTRTRGKGARVSRKLPFLAFLALTRWRREEEGRPAALRVSRHRAD